MRSRSPQHATCLIVCKAASAVHSAHLQTRDMFNHCSSALPLSRNAVCRILTARCSGRRGHPASADCRGAICSSETGDWIAAHGQSVSLRLECSHVVVILPHWIDGSTHSTEASESAPLKVAAEHVRRSITDTVIVSVASVILGLRLDLCS